jgi:Recombination endonuclease VII
MTTWQSQTPIDAARFLRMVSLQGPDTDGYLPLEDLHNTMVRNVFNALAAAGLPFRIRVFVEVEGQHHGGTVASQFILPPITINPRGESNNSFDDLVRILRDSFNYKMENMEGQSEYEFEKILRLDFTFVASDNLAALQARLPPLAGGAQVLLPEALKNKKCCINPPVDPDRQCLRMCFIAHFHELGSHPDQLSAYTVNKKSRGPRPKDYKPAWKDVPIDINALPFDQDGTTEHLDSIEQANPNVGIYVYEFHRSVLEGVFEWFPVMRRAAKNRGPREHEIVLLHFRSHWLYIKDFSGFMSQKNNEIQGSTRTNMETPCHRCMEFIDPRYHSVEQHFRTCKGETEGEDFVPKVLLPSERNPKDRCVAQFKDVRHNFMRPFWCVADLELFFTKLNGEKVVGENRDIASAGVHFVGQDGFVPDPQFQCCMFVQMLNNVVKSYHAESEPVDVQNSTPFRELLRKLFQASVVWYKKRKSIIDNGMTPEEWKRFHETKECETCGQSFKGIKVIKCRDHDHLSGKFRAVLCDTCNKKAKQPVELLVLTHNGTGYDHHYYLRAIADLQNGPDGDLTLEEFTGMQVFRTQSLNPFVNGINHSALETHVRRFVAFNLALVFSG